MNRSNIASRAASWSARHRRTAILGWIAFVVLSLGIGSVVGTQNIADEDQGTGDSRTADRILADAGFPDDASEQVFIQSRRRPERRRSRVPGRDPRRRVAARGRAARRGGRSPRSRPATATRSPPTAARRWSRSSSAATTTRRRSASTRRRPRSPRPRGRIPELRSRGVRRRQPRAGGVGEPRRGLPARRVPLAAAHAADPRGRLRRPGGGRRAAAARAHRRDGDARAARAR